MSERMKAKLQRDQDVTALCRAVYINTNPRELNEEWQMVANEKGHYLLAVVHRYVPVAEYEEAYATLSAQYGAENIVDLGITYDAAPYYLGVKRIGSEDMEDITLFIDQAYMRENYLLRLKDQQEDGDDSLETSQILMAVSLLSDEDYEEVIKELREQAKAKICVLLTQEEALKAAEDFYLVDPHLDKTIMSEYDHAHRQGAQLIKKLNLG